MTEKVTEQEFSAHRIEFDRAQAEAFLAFASAVSSHDGTPPFSEQTLVEIRKIARHPEANGSVIAVLASESESVTSSTQILGGVIAVADKESGVITLEGAVAPSFRGRGIGLALAQKTDEELTAEDFSQRHLWVHQIRGEDATGERKAAEILARSFDFSPVRELRKMQLWLSAEVRAEITQDFAQIHIPEDIAFDTFVPGQDDAAWISANAQAFADHPEQGALKQEDLQERIDSDWFRADGFILARDHQKIAGFHWTKIPTQQSEDLEGEIYAVGIVPEWQGKKLGRAITLAGMKYLADFNDESGHPLAKIVLYVDADNITAVALYKSLGFVEETVDIMYSNQA